MKVGEIPVNATIQIRVSLGDKKFECMGVVVARRDGGLYLTLLKHNGQIIDFSSEKIQILLFYVNSERQAFGWSGCKIRKDTYQGKLCHLLTTKRDSVRVNRRGEPRIRTELPALLRSIYDDREYPIVIRNYSENGIGFVCENKIPEREWSPISVIYEDQTQNLYLSMRVNILREMQLPSGLYRYGVNILQPDETWITYVTNKLDKLRAQAQEMPDDEG